MAVSEHTAGDHLKAILAKTGARTRQFLLACGLARGNGAPTARLSPAARIDAAPGGVSHRAGAAVPG